MVAQWGRYSIRGSSSCASVCMLDRHLTHRLPLFSLGWLVFKVTHAGWELCGTTRVLLHCLPPGHVSLCVCFCVCFWGRQRWHDYYQENTFKILAFVLNQKETLREWCGKYVIPPLYCLHLCSLFHHCYPSFSPINSGISNSLHWCYPASLCGSQAAWPAFIPTHHLH